MAMEEIEAGYWVPLAEYLELKQISSSTARRRIKAGQVKAQLRKGKYYIYVLWGSSHAAEDAASSLGQAKWPGQAAALLVQQVDDLRQQVRSLKQENADLKMLVQAYEAKLATAASSVKQV